MVHTANRTKDMEQCIQHCTDCHRVCVETATHCLGMGGEHASPEHQTLLQDCAQICQTSADSMSRGSAHHAVTCRACAELCEACAADCERMGGGDQQMGRCAQVCRACADSCRRMAGRM